MVMKKLLLEARIVVVQDDWAVRMHPHSLVVQRVSDRHVHLR